MENQIHPTNGRRPWTIAQRIVWLALVPAVLVVGVGAGFLRQQMHAALYASMAQTLQDKHQRVAARLRATPGLGLSEAAGSADEFSTIYSGWYWQTKALPSSAADGLLDQQGHAAAQSAAQAKGKAAPIPSDSQDLRGISRSLWDAPPIQARPFAGQQHLGLVRATGPMGESLLGWQRKTHVTGQMQPVMLTVFGPAQALLASLHRIDRILLACLAALLALLTGLLIVQLRIGLSPLRRFTQAVAAQRDAAPTLHDMLALPVGTDLAPLQQELHALLQQNTRVVSRARAHAADLNHALKKPLALLTAAASQQELLPSADVLQQTEAMAQLIDRYQARTWSDAAQVRAVSSTVDVAECLHEVTHAMRKLHAAQELDWQLYLPVHSPWRWRGDRTDLEEALGNLLDNAGKWAASTVAVSVEHRDASMLIHIDDDGPGMSTDQLQRAGQRGLRFDESVGGHGLGLAIARQIAHAYEGDLVLTKSPQLMGLRASLRLTGLVKKAQN
ncbi:sensor histidine kinase [Ottowia sp.]|uniref:sensor histidine kinase n=1 Tax=Ottowia sp. TaxID=1898956 RepID=UPI003A89EF0F